MLFPFRRRLETDKGEIMKDFIISCDQTSDLPEKIREKVSTQKMVYMIDSVEMGGNTGKDMTIEEFYAAMRNGAVAKTSQVTEEEAVEYFDGFASQGIGVMHIPLAAALSATSENCRKAAETINKKYGETLIYSVDSLSQSGGLGLLITLAQLKKESGASLKETYEYVEKIKSHVCHYFVVDSLSYLARGGRISKASAFLGAVMRIKPLLHTDELGRLVPIKKIMSRKKSLNALVDKMEERYNRESDIVYLSHGDCLDDAKYVAGLIKEKFGIEPEIMPLCRVVGCHSGPGTVALFFTADTRVER